MDLTPELVGKRDRLLSLLGELGSCAVAFSGGIDSTVVAQAAQLALGERAVAVTADSASVPRREIDDARDLARRTPDSVRQVITLGSPFRIARRSQTRAGKVFERFSHLHVEHRTFPLEHDAEPLRVPATSIYSHFDGIVHWQTCLDTPGERCENIAVMASHLGLGHHPASIWAIADRLAQPEGTWQPFKAPRFLRPGGWLAFEVGLGQARGMRKRLEQAGAYDDVREAADAEGAVRALAARRKADA